eukprot:Platyproteum_vivax@DN3234_c0_g1_i1.p1
MAVAHRFVTCALRTANGPSLGTLRNKLTNSLSKATITKSKFLATFGVLGASIIFFQAGPQTLECESLMEKTERIVEVIKEETTTQEAELTSASLVMLELSIGSVLGLTLGHILRRVGRIICGFVGMYVLTTQIGVLMHWVNIEWKKMVHDMFGHNRKRMTLASMSLLVGLLAGGYTGFHFTTPPK